jgi:hypothetical protein
MSRSGTGPGKIKNLFFAASWGLLNFSRHHGAWSDRGWARRWRLVQIKPQNHFRTTFDQHGIQSRVSVCSAKRTSNDQAFNRQRPLKGVPKAWPSLYRMIYLRTREKFIGQAY